MRPADVKWMPTFVPSSFSSTMSEASAMKARDSFWPRCLSSSVPREPNRCGVRGYLVKSSRDAPMTTILRAVSLHRLRQTQPYQQIVQRRFDVNLPAIHPVGHDE